MTPLLIFFLAGTSFFIQPSDSRKCYTCNTQLNNEKCKTEKNCVNSNAFCKTDVISIIGSINIINKECSSDCTPLYKDFTVGKRNVTCCSTELCNVNGAHAFRINYFQVALAALASLACIFLGNKL